MFRLPSDKSENKSLKPREKLNASLIGHVAGLTRQHTARLCRAGHLPGAFQTAGGHWRIRWSLALADWIAQYRGITRREAFSLVAGELGRETGSGPAKKGPAYLPREKRPPKSLLKLSAALDSIGFTDIEKQTVIFEVYEHSSPRNLTPKQITEIAFGISQRFKKPEIFEVFDLNPPFRK